MTRNRFFFLLIVLSQVAAGGLQAADIDSLARAIASSSPEVRALRYNRMAAAEEVAAENVPANPEAELEHLWGMNQIGNKLTVGVSQEFDLPMVYRSRHNLYSALRSEADAEALAAEMDVCYRAKRALIEIAYGRAIAAMQDSAASVADRRAAVVEGMLGRGEATRMDVYKARMKAIESRRNAGSEVRQIAALRQSLTLMNGGRDVDVSGVSLPHCTAAPQPWSSYKGAYDRYAPYAALAEAAGNSAASRRKAIAAERWPSLSLGYVCNVEMGEKFHGLSVGVSLPVYSRKKRRMAAELAADEAAVNIETQANSVLSDMRSSYDEALSLWRELEQMRGITANDDDVKIIERMRQVGRVDSVDYLGELADMLAARATVLAMERDYALAVASLMRFGM